MKFHLFEIVYQDPGSKASLLKRINDLMAKSMGRRELPVNGKTVALEKHEQIRHKKRNLHLIDVMDASSTDLPGRYTKKKKNEDLPLDEGDQSSQQTMALFVSTEKHDYLVCQYNHFGIKASVIFAYLGKLQGIYQLKSVINAKTRKAFEKSLSVRKLRVKIAATDAMTAQLANIPIFNAIKNSMDLNAGYIELTLSHGPNNSLFSKGMKKIVESFSSFPIKTKDVPKIEATVKHQSGEPTEVLDLFGQRVSLEQSNESLVKTKGGRYDYASRRKAIINVLDALIAQNYIKG